MPSTVARPRDHTIFYEAVKGERDITSVIAAPARSMEGKRRAEIKGKTDRDISVVSKSITKTVDQVKTIE